MATRLHEFDSEIVDLHTQIGKLQEKINRLNELKQDETWEGKVYRVYVRPLKINGKFPAKEASCEALARAPHFIGEYFSTKRLAREAIPVFARSRKLVWEYTVVECDRNEMSVQELYDLDRI